MQTFYMVRLNEPLSLACLRQDTRFWHVLAGSLSCVALFLNVSDTFLVRFPFCFCDVGIADDNS